MRAQMGDVCDPSKWMRGCCVQAKTFISQTKSRVELKNVLLGSSIQQMKGIALGTMCSHLHDPVQIVSSLIQLSGAPCRLGLQIFSWRRSSAKEPLEKCSEAPGGEHQLPLRVFLSTKMIEELFSSYSGKQSCLSIYAIRMLFRHSHGQSTMGLT